MSSNGYAGASELLAMTARRYEDVPTPAGLFRIQSLTEKERAHLETKMNDEAELFRGSLIAMCVVDGDGNRILTEDQAQQLLDVDSRVTSIITDAIGELCGAINEETEKN